MASTKDGDGCCRTRAAVHRRPGAKHAGIEIIILKGEVPFGECLVAELFYQGSQQRPQPAANRVFNREQGPSLVGTEQDSNAGPIDGICRSHLLGLERPETGQAEQCIGAAEWSGPLFF